ncbi:MAG: hypothetical protein M3R24_39000 [Chloroflexota bacterium]|nr:hypothetical protein [Chloroflexota bacterium]
MPSSAVRCVPNGTSSTLELADQHRQHFPPQPVHADGHEPVTVVSRFGTVALSRQVCLHPQTQIHVMPGNAFLPPDNGIIVTRGLQEWAYLLPQELPFASVARLLGWQTWDDANSSASLMILDEPSKRYRA